MIYRVQVNRRVRNIRVYNVLRKTGPAQNPLTKVFMRVFGGRRPGEAVKE